MSAARLPKPNVAIRKSAKSSSADLPAAVRRFSTTYSATEADDRRATNATSDR